MKASDYIRKLERLASSQWGMFTTAQATARGVNRTQISRMVNYGMIEPVRKGIYRISDLEETSHSHIKAAWLACYPKLTARERLRKNPLGTVVACTTAAYLHGIGDFCEEPYTFIVSKRRQSTQPDLSFHMRQLDEYDITMVDDLPVTTLERTVADLVREQLDPKRIIRAAQSAFMHGGYAYDLQQSLLALPYEYDGDVSLMQTPDDLFPEDERADFVAIADEVMELCGGHDESHEPETIDTPTAWGNSSYYGYRRLALLIQARTADAVIERSEEESEEPCDYLDALFAELDSDADADVDLYVDLDGRW